MSQSTTTPSPSPAHSYDAAEGFLGVVWRRTRYVVAIALSATLFLWLGWKIAAPPPDWAGVSLMAWPGSSIFSALVLALILLVATAVCSLIVHPDSPHMGLFCSLLGMAALSIRGGSVHLLMVHTEHEHHLRELAAGKVLPHPFADVATSMALECVIWGCVILLADVFARLIHDQFLSNHHWVMRTEPELGKRVAAKAHLGAAVGFSKSISRRLMTDRIKGVARIPLAMLLSGALGFLFLYVFMQTQLKGQALMACFVAFLISTLCAYMVFPTAPFWALILAVPLTGAVAFALGRNAVAVYPGHAPFFAMRALPIDYLTAGVPGAILGLYWGFGWAVGSAED